MQSELSVPVLFLIFNRPSTTRVVFDVLRRARPHKLYIAADGPRKGKAGEKEKCDEARAIATAVDWPCDVKTLFREENEGCGRGVSNGINWFFSNEPEGIILEDDCVPDLTFFPYCAELLERYRHDHRIMEISGNTIWPEEFCQTTFSYSFSCHNGIWGWASWRRAWNLYDYEMKKYPKIKAQGYLNNKFNSIFEQDYFQFVFERTHLFPHITWDYQWEFAKRINSGATIVPNKNMVVNIGFGSEATSTTNTNNPASDLGSAPMNFPLDHPPFLMVDNEADKQAFINFHTSLSSRIKTFVKSMLPATVKKKLFEAAMKRFVESQKKVMGRAFDILLYIVLAAPA